MTVAQHETGGGAASLQAAVRVQAAQALLGLGAAEGLGPLPACLPAVPGASPAGHDVCHMPRAAGAAAAAVAAAAGQEIPDRPQEGAIPAPPPRRAAQLGLVHLLAWLHGCRERRRQRMVSPWPARLPAGSQQGRAQQQLPLEAVLFAVQHPRLGGQHPRTWLMDAEPRGSSRSIHSNTDSRGAPSSRSITPRTCSAGIGGTCRSGGTWGAGRGCRSVSGSLQRGWSTDKKGLECATAKHWQTGKQEALFPHHSAPHRTAPGRAAATACGRSAQAQNRHGPQ